MVADVTRQRRGPICRRPTATGGWSSSCCPRCSEAGRRRRSRIWGLLGLGLNRWLLPIDDATRSPFMPYGLSGIMLGAAIVFFAYIGFDSISTHAEEARNPQRDVPIGILISLLLCTVLYMAVAAVITGMVPYPRDRHQCADRRGLRPEGRRTEHSLVLRGATVLIAAGGLAGMTSVLLVLFLSQARIFMAMARDGLLPRVFGAVHPRFRTPHIATMVTGVVICLVAALDADPKAGRDGQHRHADGVRDGLRGGDDPPHPASRRSPAVPLPGGLAGGPAGDCRQLDA